MNLNYSKHNINYRLLTEEQKNSLLTDYKLNKNLDLEKEEILSFFPKISITDVAIKELINNNKKNKEKNDRMSFINRIVEIRRPSIYYRVIVDSSKIEEEIAITNNYSFEENEEE